MPLLDERTLGPTRLGFAAEADLDAFMEKLGEFERGELPPDAWKQFRLVNGVYSQRQEGDAMMVRVKIPQGVLTPAQLRALAEVAERYSTGRGHITTRQNVQFHFVPLAKTDEALALLATAGLTTREACGNSVRNVTACPHAGASALEPFDTTPWAEAVTRHLLRGPLSSSLPRKFKIAFGGCCGSDCVGASFNDVGLLARLREGKPGFRVTLGGGLSTLRRAGILAHEFAPAEEVIEICEAVVRVFNRTGDRQHRHRARLKFVVDKLGPDEFLRQYFEERKGVRHRVEATPSVPLRIARCPRHRAPQPGLEEFARTNVRAQRDPEYVTVTVRAPLGDLTTAQFRALAALSEEFSEEREARTTLEQNLLLRFVRRAHLGSLHAALSDAGLARPGAETIADVVSCPGAYSCRLAVTQSRGMADALTRALEGRQEKLPIKISGCPNGCGQHYVAGIGLQGSVRKVDGRAVPQYHLYLGGGFGDTEAAFGRLAAKVPARKVPEAVARLADLYAAEALPQETPDAFFARLPVDRVTWLLADLEHLEHAAPLDFVDLGEEKAFEVQTSEGECAA
ncbi:MAG TPA: nitrite/sulfite reductase [Myxococcales bacterium]|nr:nitrite/sulfite reductase [Myxococcales bacterium]